MPTAYFLVNVALNHELEILEKIKGNLSNDTSIKFEIQGVFGIYDIIVKVSSDEEKTVRKVALEKIRSIDNILSAVTMMVNEDLN